MRYRVPALREPTCYFTKIPETEHGDFDTITPEEALERLQRGKLPLVRGTLREGPHIDFTNRSSNLGSDNCSIKLHVDVDSMGFVTVSLGGGAFRMSNASVHVSWQRNFSKEREVAEANNGLTAFLGAYSSDYPGNYFGTDVNASVKNKLFRGQKQDKVLNSPMQLQILEISMGWVYPLKVYALVPSKSSILLLKGSGSLLELFLSKKREGLSQNRERKLNARHTVCEMVWYILTSAILFFSSIATRDDISPGIWYRRSCCAFPPSAMEKDTLHDRKYGHLSGYNISQKLTPGSLTIALCLFARHQRAIEQHSRLPKQFQSSDLRIVEKYPLDTELYPLVTPALLPVLQADIGSSVCLTWFQNFWSTSNDVWGDIVALRSDPKRRSDHALPSRESNINALANGQMCLEDLLCFNHVMFRGTIHGAKETAYNTRGFRDIKQVLMKTLYLLHCKTRLFWGQNNRL